MTEAQPCHNCGTSDVRELKEFRDLCRVTSDCRSWPAGGRLGECNRCGLLQAIADSTWRTEIDEIYRSYDIYYQSGGIEQKVFEAEAGVSSPRSQHLVGRLGDEARLPDRGRMLDIGCGNGAFIRAASSAYPGWELFGSELSDKYREVVEAIPGVKAFFGGGLEKIEEKFDLISLIHVLEHIESPARFLSSIERLLNPGGKVFIEVPYFVDNPFDLVIADHASHFTPGSLSAVARQGRYEVHLLSTAWVTKEISGLLSPVAVSAEAPTDRAAESDQAAARRVNWLTTCRRDLGRPADAERFGIFGTSIGATWLHDELTMAGMTVDFFVDQDPSRIGQSLFDRPVHAPRDIPAGSVVSIPLAPVVASRVADQLRDLPCRLILPDLLDRPDSPA